MEIRGRGALVTGAGRGLGAELARALAREGARVVLVARTAAEVEAVAAGIRRGGGEAHALAADVGDKTSVHAIAAAAVTAADPLDIVVHNASVLGPAPLRLLADSACEDLARVLEVNLVGPFRLTKALLGPMLLRGRGLVLHISSDAATSAYPRWGLYGASKAALDHLSRIWAAELEDTGVRFLGVDPGEMATRMHAEAMPDADPSTLADPAAVAEAVLEIIRGAEAWPTGTRLHPGSWARTPVS